ncbi:hypothetical protein JD969_14120 [Planctomycetota bacterium]|nr:hypothetical protein JD969_14120 [Planctomycetota bacterium]
MRKNCVIGLTLSCALGLFGMAETKAESVQITAQGNVHFLYNDSDVNVSTGDAVTFNLRYSLDENGQPLTLEGDNDRLVYEQAEVTVNNQTYDLLAGADFANDLNVTSSVETRESDGQTYGDRWSTDLQNLNLGSNTVNGFELDLDALFSINGELVNALTNGLNIFDEELFGYGQFWALGTINGQTTELFVGLLDTIEITFSEQTVAVPTPGAGVMGIGMLGMMLLRRRGKGAA